MPPPGPDRELREAVERVRVWGHGECVRPALILLEEHVECPDGRVRADVHQRDLRAVAEKDRGSDAPLASLEVQRLRGGREQRDGKGGCGQNANATLHESSVT